MRSLARFALCLAPIASLAFGCGSDQKHTATAEEVRDGEAIPPAPPVPPTPAPSTSPAQASASGTGENANAGSLPAQAAAPSAEPLSEAQIAKVSEVVNAAELEQAKLAQRKAKAQNVKQFADMMIRHHGQAQREQARLMQQLKLSSAESATATKLKVDGDARLAQLKSSDSASFDSTYITSQIEAHEQLLELLDHELIPGARTPTVANALQMARSAVEDHLRQARALRQ